MFGGASMLFVIPMIVSAILGIVGTIFGAIVTYKSNRRTSSGTVATSNANELWTENSRLMDRLTKEIDRLTRDVSDLQTEIIKLRDERDFLRKENIDLREKVHLLEIDMLKFHNATTITTATTTPSQEQSSMPVFIDYPVEGPITQYFGGQHGGVDLAGPDGSPVYAPCDGYLNLWPQGSQGDGSFGNAADIVTDDGWTVKIAHMREYAYSVTSGPITAGTRLGLQGYTGYTIPVGLGGSHVHWGMCRQSSFPKYTDATAHLFGNPLDYLITEAERMSLFTRLENVEKCLGQYELNDWVARGNSSLIACLGPQPASLSGMVTEWPGIKAQTYGTNDLLLAWRQAAAGQGIILP